MSFLSPCVLPLVPAYLVNIAGEAVPGRSEADARGARLHVLAHAAAFVLGFTVVFAMAGAGAGFLGELASAQGALLARGGGVVLMVLGMQMAGLIRIPFLDRTYQIGA